jgi:hypothetical protein
MDCRNPPAARHTTSTLRRVPDAAIRDNLASADESARTVRWIVACVRAARAAGLNGR